MSTIGSTADRIHWNGASATRAGGEHLPWPAGLGVCSEVGRLRRVILHRPGFELARVPRSCAAKLPMRDADRIRRVREEHDTFADTLAGRGVEVLYLNDLLVETLGLPAARDEVIDRTLASVRLRPRLRSALAALLVSLDSLELAARLVGGVAVDELALAKSGTATRPAGRSEFVLTPLADALLARRNSAWILNGIAVGTAGGAERCRQSINVAAVYRHHPRFAGRRRPTWTADLGGPARIDGDDVFLLGGGSVLITASEGTGVITAALLASRLLATEAARRVILASSPIAPTGHLLGDGMAMVDRNAFVVRRGLSRKLLVHSLRAGANGALLEREPDLLAALEHALEPESVRVIEPAMGAPANSVLAIAPGEVLAFDDPKANDALRAAGIEVTAVPGSELARCRATPRALVCPIGRDPLSRS